MFFSVCCQCVANEILYLCTYSKSAVFYILGTLFMNRRHPPAGCEQDVLARRRSAGTRTTRRRHHSFQWLSSSTCPSCTGACRSRTCRHGRTLRPTTRCQSDTSGSPLDSEPKQRFLVKEGRGLNPQLPEFPEFPEFPALTFITKGPPLSPSQESPRWLSPGPYPATCPHTLLWLPKAENSLLLKHILSGSDVHAWSARRLHIVINVQKVFI